MNVSSFDTTKDCELVGSSILTVPVHSSDGHLTCATGPSVLPPAFGEDLSVQKLLKNSIPNESHTISAQNVVSFAELVKCELQDKQKIIDALMDEVKEKNAGIQLCGKDITQLRQEKLTLETRLKKNQEIYDQAEAFNAAILESIGQTRDLDGVVAINPTQQRIVQSLDYLKSQLQNLERTNQNLENQLKHKEKELSELALLKQRHNDLENSHKQALQYLKTMKAEINKLESYRMTIHTQEKVIVKLQSVVESKLKSKYSFLKTVATKVNEAVDRSDPDSTETRNESSLLNTMVDDISLELQQQNAALTEKVKVLERTIHELETQKVIGSISRPSTNTSQTSVGENDWTKDEDHFDGQVPANYSNVKKANLKIDQLIAENVSKQFRIEALEHQLESSSRESAREIARLRTKLFELEIALSMTNNNSIPVNDDAAAEDDVEAPKPPTPTPPEKQVAIIDLQPDVLGNISPRNRQGTLITPQRQSVIAPPIAPTPVKEDQLEPEGGERTRADSGFDIDRVPTPEDLSKAPINKNTFSPKRNTLAESPGKSPTTTVSPRNHSPSKNRKEIIKEGIVERNFALYQDSDSSSTQNPTVLGVATIRFQYVHDKKQKKHVFTMTRIKVENYPLDEVKSNLELFTQVKVTGDRGNTIWSIETPAVRDPGSMVQWDHDPSQPSDDKTFAIKASEFFNYVDSDIGMTVRCTLKKRLSTEGVDQFIGAGSTSLLFSG